MRKLASIQTINAIEPIPDADTIVKAQVLGWQVVVKRDEFARGDKIVYCEIDSLLPVRPEFEFLRASSYKPAQLDVQGQTVLREGFRIKTAKLRGQVSQGICFPLSILQPAIAHPDQLEVGTDVTAALDILKWEPPTPMGMGGRIKGDFPAFLSKTDETRVQLLEDVLERHRGKEFYVTEKLDGTSFSAFIWQGEFGICSRNQWLDETDQSNLLCRLAGSLNLADKLNALRARTGVDVALQGEVIGPGIQGNKYKLQHLNLFVFNLLNLTDATLFPFETMLDHVASMDLKFVPTLPSIVLNHTVQQLVALAEGKSVLNAATQREGIVLRPFVEEFDPTLNGRLSMKAISPKFLLKYDE